VNIIMPLAGRGSRFASSSLVPKPMIPINGKPMIYWAITSLGLNGNWFFLLRKDGFEEFIKAEIKKVVPQAKFRVIDYVTEGPACSALLFEEDITSDELVIANCDQIMEWNAELFLYNARYPTLDGMIVTYHSDTEKNSYAAMDRNGYVTKLREKEVISNISLNGIHYWRNGEDFVTSAKEMIEADDRAYNGEFYISQSYNYLIDKGKKIGIYHIPNQMHHPVGVPADLERYLHDHR